MEPTGYDNLPKTEPIKLPMHDQFGNYFNEWVHEAQRKNDEIVAN